MIGYKFSIQCPSIFIFNLIRVNKIIIRYFACKTMHQKKVCIFTAGEPFSFQNLCNAKFGFDFWLWMQQSPIFTNDSNYIINQPLYFFLFFLPVHCVILFKNFCWWHWFSAIRLQWKLIFFALYTEIETNVIIPFILHRPDSSQRHCQLLLKLQKFTKSCNHFHYVHLILFAIILSKETFLLAHTHGSVFFFINFNICSEVFQFRWN